MIEMKNDMENLSSKLSSLVFLLSFLLGLPILGAAQELIKPHYGKGQPEVVNKYLTTTLDNGEVVPWFPIKEVIITRKRGWKSEKERVEYLQLKKNIIRVLPYAIYAQKRYEQLDRDLILAENKREEKHLIRNCEKEIKTKFNTEIKNLTISQGKLLVKLIERQTGNTSYDMLKDVKGGLSAIIYQGIAGLFGHNLKATYDPQEDYEIENIVREFEKSRGIRTSQYQ